MDLLWGKFTFYAKSKFEQLEPKSRTKYIRLRVLLIGGVVALI